MHSLTKRQKQVIDYIREFLDFHGHSPSYEEIAAGLGLSSVSTIHAHVENLRRKGYLTKKWNANRSIDLTRPMPGRPPFEEVPLAGRIAAGKPLEAIPEGETMSIPADMLGREETYILRVSGDSMIDDHVMDGDYIIVEKRDTPREGEMVVALVHNSEATLKRFRRRGSRIVLVPANPAFQPLEFDEHDVSVQGVVVGILRKYGR
jgi:repressor LexA